MKTSRKKFRRVRLALRHKRLTRVHEAMVRDTRLHDVVLDAIAIDELGLGPSETALLLAMQEDKNNAA